MEVLNIYASIAGWLAFNVILFRIEKDRFDKIGERFPLTKYVSETWDNWLASFVFLPVLWYIGYKQLALDPFADLEVTKMQWSDLYYVCSGFIVELIIVTYQKWKGKQP